MKRLVMTSALLLIGLIFVGCYTQIGGYYEARRPVQRVSDYREERDDTSERTQVEDSRNGEEKTQIEGESKKEEAEVEEDEGYYGRRKPTDDDYAPYYRTYGIYPDSYYPPYPYWGYEPFYPYYGRYSFDPYYGGYYRHHHYYDSYPGYPYRYYRNSDLYQDRQRSQSERGVGSPRSSSERPRRASMSEESKETSPRSSPDSSGSRYQRLPRLERRR